MTIELQSSNFGGADIYDPERLRRLVRRAGPTAEYLLDRPLTYWHAKSNPFPHAERECPILGRSRSPIADTYTLRNQDEGWCCHDCSIDPPDEELVLLMERFNELRALEADFSEMRLNENQMPLDVRTLEYYRDADWAYHLERHNAGTPLAVLSTQLADGCLHQLQTAQGVLRRKHPRRFGQPGERLRNIVVDNRVARAETLDDLDQVDWYILYNSAPCRGRTTELRLTVPTSLMVSSRLLHDLGATSPTRVSVAKRRRRKADRGSSLGS